jgi:hypothetical protein
MLYALNSLTGEPVWVFNPPNREYFDEWNWGQDSDLNTANGCCDMTIEGMSKPWMNCRAWDSSTLRCTDTSGLSQQDIVGPNAWAYTESDIAYDGVHVYQAVMNSPRLFTIENVRDFGNPASTIEQIDPKNTTIWAIDVNTGEPAWSYFLEGQSYRGGMMVTGGVVYAYASDGNLIMLDSTTGELLHTKFFGVPVSAAPSIGADSEGNHKVFLHIGGGGGFLFASTQLPGNLAAFALPDTLPEPEIVEVIREVPGPVVEVPGPVVEIPGPERIVEVPGPEVEIQVISPISYVAIGLGVVLVVIAGVLFTRRRST